MLWLKGSISRATREILGFEARGLQEHWVPKSAKRSWDILDILTNESSNGREGFSPTFDRKRGSAWDIEVVCRAVQTVPLVCSVHKWTWRGRVTSGILGVLSGDISKWSEWAKALEQHAGWTSSRRSLTPALAVLSPDRL